MNPVINIPQEAPFTNCKLGREPYAKVLTDIVRTNSDGFVLAIDNKWGAGKTTFVSMWSQMLQNEEFQTLYFNAWENDFENNPFVAITAELKELLKDDTSESFKEVLKKGSKISKAVIPSVMKAFLKRYTGDEVAEIMKQYSEGVLQAFQEDIDSYVDRKKNIKEFHDDLEVYIKQNSNDKPIVFIIDELDRCRPDYAVSVLENVKHLFSVKGIVFVLSIDKEQLGHAICGAYGSDKIDSEEYLRRFINIEYQLPKPDVSKYYDFLIEIFGVNKFFKSEVRVNSEVQKDARGFRDYALFIFSNQDLTLRQQEKIMSHVGIVLKSFDKRSYIIPELLMYLVYIRLFHSKMYGKINRKEFSQQELLNENGKIFYGELSKNDKRTLINLEAFLFLFYNEYLEYENQITFEFSSGEEGRKISEDFSIKSSFDKSEGQNEFINCIYYEFNSYSRRRASIDYLLTKIDLLEPLNEF